MDGVLGQVFGFPTGQNYTALQQSEYGDLGAVSSTSTSIVKLVKRGSSGLAVRHLHWALGTSSRLVREEKALLRESGDVGSGTFGAGTERAVRRYQHRVFGADGEDGKVGKDTWRELSKDTGVSFVYAKSSGGGSTGSGSTGGGTTNAANALILPGENKKINWKMILGIGGGVLALIVLLGVLRKKKRKG